MAEGRAGLSAKDVGEVIAIVFVSGIGLFFGAAWFCQYLQIGPWSPYRREVYPLIGVEGIFTAKTLFGHLAQYQLKVWMKPVDREAFKAARMFGDEGRREFLERFNTEIFLPLMKNTGRFFLLDFSHYYPGVPVPAVHIYQWQKSAYGEVKADWDLNCSGIAELASKAEHPAINGCQITSPMLITCGLFDAHVIQANCAAVGKEEIEAMRYDKEFLFARECAALGVYMEIQRIRSSYDTKAYETPSLQVERTIIDEGVYIKWTKRGRAGYRVVGYRSENQYTAEELGDSFGARIVDSGVAADSTIDRALQRGQMYFYHFALVKPNQSFDATKPISLANPRVYVVPDSVIKFDAYLPGIDELQRLKEINKRLEQQGQSGEKGEHWNRLGKLLEETRAFVEVRGALAQAEQEAIARVKKMDSLTEKQREELIDDLQERVAHHQRNLFR